MGTTSSVPFEASSASGLLALNESHAVLDGGVLGGVWLSGAISSSSKSDGKKKRKKDSASSGSLNTPDVNVALGPYHVPSAALDAQSLLPPSESKSAEDADTLSAMAPSLTPAQLLHASQVSHSFFCS